MEQSGIKFRNDLARTEVKSFSGNVSLFGLGHKPDKPKVFFHTLVATDVF